MKKLNWSAICERLIASGITAAAILLILFLRHKL
jgi:hypothetical protein